MCLALEIVCDISNLLGPDYNDIYMAARLLPVPQIPPSRSYIYTDQIWMESSIPRKKETLEDIKRNKGREQKPKHGNR